MPEVRPVRYCHGCMTYDDAPRVIAASDMHRPEDDKLYHYDCAPADISAALPSQVTEVVNSGKQGDELHAELVSVAQSLPEES